MKLSSIRVENFRSFVDSTIQLNDYVCLVGPNGSGKSNVLSALNVFFRETQNNQLTVGQLVEEDFHQKNTNCPIRITVEFTDLSTEAQKDFADYFRHGKLVVTAVAEFDSNTNQAVVKQYGQRSGIVEFAQFFKAESNNVKVPELKEIYRVIKDQFPSLPASGIKSAMINNLRNYEANNLDKCQFIPSEDQFYGFSKGVNRLAKHVHWVYVPAVKDPTGEQVESRNSALGKILARTVRSKVNFEDAVKTLRSEMQNQYQILLDQHQSILDETTHSLQSRISEWAHPEARLRLEWKQDLEKSVRVDEPWAHIITGEGEFEGELFRFGHGLQRSFLLALLQELAEIEVTVAPTLILGCEEPELYQHPPQARHLASVLHKLSTTNSQVIVTTHNPLFVSGEGFESVRMVRKAPGSLKSSVSHISFTQIAQTISTLTQKQINQPEGVLAKVHQALQPQLNEMFFARRLILVEGLEDQAYLITYLNLFGLSDEFRRIGCHIVSTNGKSELVQSLAIALHMGIPTYVVFDGDVDKKDKNGSRQLHEKDNKCLLLLMNEKEQDPMPNQTIWGKGFTIWHSDIGKVVEGDIGKEEWQACRSQADVRFGHIGGLKKNMLHIGESLTIAWERGVKSENLEHLCKEILDPENSVQNYTVQNANP